MVRLLLYPIFLPLQLIMLVFFLLSSLTGRLVSLFRPETKTRHSSSLERPDCTIIMLNWNGVHLLKESIPALMKSISREGGNHQVMVVDNGSTDESIPWLEENYPEIDILGVGENLGFGRGNNLGVESARTEIVVLLNNDMIVSRGFLWPLLDGFKEPDVFAVTSQVHFPEGRRREETGATAAYFSLGYLNFTHLPICEGHLKRNYLPVLWPGGGSSAFRRSMFLELGGFSDLYSPCYQEDVDLGYRAWQRGWHSLLASDSNVLHKHRSTSAKIFRESELRSLVEERKLWFIWRNLGLATVAPHLLLLPLSLTKAVPAGTYLHALRKLPAVLADRARMPLSKYSDREIMEWAEHPLSYLNRFRGNRFTGSVEKRRLKILIVSCYLPHLGTHGGAGRVFQLMKRVAEKHEVTLVTYLENEKEKYFLHQAEDCCHRVIPIMRGAFRQRSWFPYEPFEEFNCDSLRLVLEGLAAAEDYDIVHFEWTQMAEFSDLFPFTPKVITEVEVNWAAHRTLVSVEPNPFRKAKMYYNTLQTLYRETELCGKVEKVVCVTDDDKGYLEGYVEADKLEVINTGVDLDYFEYSEEGRDPSAIVFVGAFRHSPNLDAMFYFHRAIFPAVLDRHPACHLYIVGSSPPEDIQALGESPNITVTGFVEDIRDYYRIAQVVVVPLRTGVGIRGKVLEGWAAGSAMVASPLACQGIKAAHGKNIMIADNPARFAEYTVDLLKDPEKCRNLARNGRKTAEELYGWDVMGRKMISFYEEIHRDESPSFGEENQ